VPAVFTRRGGAGNLHASVAGSLHLTWSRRQSSRVGCRRQFSTRESPPGLVPAVFTRRLPAPILHQLIHQVTILLFKSVWTGRLVSGRRHWRDCRSFLQGRDYPIRPWETRYVSSLWRVAWLSWPSLANKQDCKNQVMTTDQVLFAKCKLSWNRNLFTCCQGRVIRNVRLLLNTTDLNWFHPSPIKSLSTAKCQSNSFVENKENDLHDDFHAALLIRTTLTGSMKNAALSECQYIASCVHSPIVVSLKQKGMAYEIFHWCYKAMYSGRISFFPLLFRMLRYRSHQMSCSFYLLYFHWCYKAMYSCRISFFPLPLRMLRYRSHQMSCSFYFLYYRPIFVKINVVMQNLYLNLHVGNLFGEPKILNKDTRIYLVNKREWHMIYLKCRQIPPQQNCNLPDFSK
jgi:hypothetical protein